MKPIMNMASIKQHFRSEEGIKHSQKKAERIYLQQICFPRNARVLQTRRKKTVINKKKISEGINLTNYTEKFRVL
jgi:hypothetical protein